MYQKTSNSKNGYIVSKCVFLRNGAIQFVSINRVPSLCKIHTILALIGTVPTLLNKQAARKRTLRWMQGACIVCRLAVSSTWIKYWNLCLETAIEEYHYGILQVEREVYFLYLCERRFRFSLYTSHCWALISSQNERDWAVDLTRVQWGLRTSHHHFWQKGPLLEIGRYASPKVR